MPTRHPCTCGEEWAAHGLGDAVRRLTVGRAVIERRVRQLGLGTLRAGRVHLTEEEIAQIRQVVQASRRG